VEPCCSPAHCATSDQRLIFPIGGERGREAM
jgi:hypothetical protein